MDDVAIEQYNFKVPATVKLVVDEDPEEMFIDMTISWRTSKRVFWEKKFQKVFNLRQEIAEDMGMEIANVNLLHMGETMWDDFFVRGYNVKEGSNILWR